MSRLNERECAGLLRCAVSEQRCWMCGCTAEDVGACVTLTGERRCFVEADLCSACAPVLEQIERSLDRGQELVLRPV